MQGPLVSVILPVYNIRQDYLNLCLSSLARQAYANLEIILVDDGSTNDAPAACDAFCQREPRARCIHQANAGVSVARNSGLDAAHGDYVCFVDPDDWVAADYAGHLLFRAQETDADIAVCGCTFCVGSRREPNPFLEGGAQVLRGQEKNALLYQLVGKAICPYYPRHIAAGVPWGKLFRADFLREHDLGFVPGMVRMQDNIFCLHAIEAAESISYLDENLYCYRKETGSASHSYNPRIVGYFERYFDITRAFLDQYHKEDVLYRALDAKTLTSVNSYLVNYYFNAENPDPWPQRLQALDGLLDQPRYAQALQTVGDGMLTRTERPFVHALRRRDYGLLRLMVVGREALLNRGA